MLKRMVRTGTLIVIIVLASVKILFAQDKLQASIERGKKVYTGTCLACHQASGGGVPGMNPPLKKSPWVVGKKDTLINIVLKGLDRVIEVNGQTYENVMPAIPTLSDLEIADVLTYVRNNFGNKASAVTPKEVKKLRNK